MNKVKGIILTSLITILLGLLIGVNFYYEEDYEIPNHIYQVYLDGEKIGLINSKDELYDLINNEQVEIKDKYKVNQVYPPKGFQIIKKNTYDNSISSVQEVYDSIKDKKEFTLKGYTITIKTKTEGAEPIYIYVLDKSIFEQAIDKVVETFITEERYKQFKDGTQPEITDVGYVIESMYFDDTISIKESYISVNETIYTNVEDLTRYLLFSENSSVKEYTVVKGDTVEKIAEANELNPNELLLVNQDIRSVDTILAIGQKLDVSLIKPVLTLLVNEYIVEDVEEQYQTIYREDKTQYTDYVKTIQEGVNGINRITSRTQINNGEQSQGREIIESETKVIRPTQDKIIVKGTKKRNNYYGEPFDTGGTWYWPTNRPYIITSRFGWRRWDNGYRDYHQGNDIAVSGYKSPIYAALGGTVVVAASDATSGCHLVIDHHNGYLTFYGHIAIKAAKEKYQERQYYAYKASQCDFLVKVGDNVKRGQQIARMGRTGATTGVHLHFALYKGSYNRNNVIDSLRLWR